MIMLDRNSVYNKELKELIKAYSNEYVSMDIDSIKRDTEKIKNEMKSANTYKKSILKDLVNYLKELEKRVQKNKNIKIDWKIDEKNFSLKNIEFNLVSMKWCSIDIVDYINKMDEKTVSVSYRDLWNALAYDISYRDLEYMSLGQLDNKLRTSGITIINPQEELEKIVYKNSYNEAINMKIENSPYSGLNYNGEKYAVNYFNDKVEYNGFYKPIIESSINKAMLIILEYILGKEIESLKFIGIFEDRMYYNINKSNEYIENSLGESYCLNILGRKFELKPNISIY